MAAPAPAARPAPSIMLPPHLSDFARGACQQGGAGAVKAALGKEALLRELAQLCFEALGRAGSTGFERVHSCVALLNSVLGVGACSRQNVVRATARFGEALGAAEFQKVYRQLLLAKLNEYEPPRFCREMFIRRRQGSVEEHYELRKVLGKGAYGVVQKVECKKTRAQRVVKVVDKQRAVESGLPLEVLMEEIETLKALDHPALLRLFEYFVDDAAIYMVTDFMPGGLLMDVLVMSLMRRMPLAEEWTRKAFLDVCQGITYAHAKGVMHKDLKLDNMMLQTLMPLPRAVVIDVGFAELFPVGEAADSFYSKACAGTMSIMAPEVIQGSFTYKCDVWSLGCCLFGLLCRRPDAFRKPSGDIEVHPYPFLPPEGDSEEENAAFVELQAQGPNYALLQGSQAALELLGRMLAFEANQRPTMEQVLQQPWLQEARMKQQQEVSPQALDSLLQSSNAMEQAVLLDVASQLPMEKLAEMAKQFAALDADGNGMINSAELDAMLQKAGVDPESRREAVERLTKDGPMEFSRFVAAQMKGRQSLVANHLRPAFDRLDEDGDGVVRKEQLQKLLQDNHQRRTIAAKTAENMMQAVAGRGTQVDFEHFVSAFTGSEP